MFLKSIFAISLFIPSFLLAEDVHLLNDNFTADDMLGIIFAKPAEIQVNKQATNKGKTRGIPFSNIGNKSVIFHKTTTTEQSETAIYTEPEQGRTSNPTETSNCPVHNKVIAVNINFKNNQYLLNRSSFSTVGQVAKAIHNPKLSGCLFLIEGHTNSIGSASSNLRLSSERAKTVKMLLHSMNIKNSHLKAVGKGETQLLYPNNGRAAANRRVQFRILTPNY